MTDMPRPVATNDDEFTLAIEDVAKRYEEAGHARTIRTLQRYCKSGHLDSIKMQTKLGDMYLVTPQSVDRHIAQIKEIEVATSRVQPRPVATYDAQKIETASVLPVEATHRNQPRPDATTTQYLAQLERENEFLRGQVSVKDTQIADLLERGKETNTLIHRLQTMLAPLLGGPDRRDSTPHNDEPTKSAQQFN